jgi:hypothetical protein
VARFGVHVLKRCAFRLGTQHFGNTYYYEDPLGTPGLSTLEALVDAVVASERSRHSTTVTFVRGRLWSQIGTPAQNQMLVDKALTGTGSATDQADMDKERAALVRFRAGVDSLGRPVYLRKWWHLCAAIGGSAVASNVLANTAALSSGQRTAIEAFGNEIKSYTLGTPSHTFTLVAKGGRPIDGATQAHQFLEHHQLGDEWRGS